MHRTFWLNNQRRGGALLLTLIAVGVSLLAALSLHVTAARATSTSSVISDLVQARMVSESGLAIAAGYVERAENWSELPAPGEWVTDLAVAGGSACVTADWPDGWMEGSNIVANASFESGAGALPTPLLNPPMSGSLGDWDVTRTALVQTGLTVPQVEIVATPSASSGAQAARIRFGAAVNGAATIRQTLGESLAADSTYTCEVDVFTSGLPALDATFGFRVFAGGDLVASTEEALTLFEHLTAEQVQSSAEALLNNAQEPATLLSSPLGSFRFAYSLTFVTPSEAPPGPIRIELFANSLGVASHIGFDNVRLSHVSRATLRLTSIGQSGSASHIVTALYGRDLSGRARVLEWVER